MGEKIRGRAAILTGERGVGKTTLCLELARGRPEFVGIVSPAIFDESGRKVGFAALCLQTGEQWDLGRSDTRPDGPVYGKYIFSAPGITRAMGCLQAALDLPGRIMVLDEIGPLEIQQHAGLAPVLPLLDRAARLLIVTRPALVARLQELLPSHECQAFTLLPETRKETAREISAFLEEPS